MSLSAQDSSQSTVAPSILVLSDRLLSMAEDADRAGLDLTAGRLVDLACAILDSPPKRRRRG